MHVVRSESESGSEEFGSDVTTFTPRTARSLLEGNAPSFSPKLEKLQKHRYQRHLRAAMTEHCPPLFS